MIFLNLAHKIWNKPRKSNGICKVGDITRQDNQHNTYFKLSVKIWNVDANNEKKSIENRFSVKFNEKTILKSSVDYHLLIDILK